MAGSLNKVTLIGNLGADPEIRSMQSGAEIANFSIATSESWKDKQTGERQERTQWHRVVVFNESLVGIVKSYMRKGSKVYIEGQLETRKWTDQSGQEKYATEVVLRPYRGTILLLSAQQAQDYDTPPAGQVQQSHAPASGQTWQQPGGFDDDVPF